MRQKRDVRAAGRALSKNTKTIKYLVASKIENAQHQAPQEHGDRGQLEMGCNKRGVSPRSPASVDAGFCRN